MSLKLNRILKSFTKVSSQLESLIEQEQKEITRAAELTKNLEEAIVVLGEETVQHSNTIEKAQRISSKIDELLS